ncbi:MAG: stage III sporulation protein AA [Lachnospiraceae bacterium]
MNKKDGLLHIFPNYFRIHWEQVIQQLNEITEVRIRVLKPIVIYKGEKEFFLNKKGRLSSTLDESLFYNEKELKDIINYICKDSMYAFERELSKGFITILGGHRIGIVGQVVEDHEKKVGTIKNISAINIRISHEIKGIGKSVLPYLYENGYLHSTLIISPPGFGKTTLLRDLIRNISDGNKYGSGISVAVVDERGEIASTYQGIAQNDVGIRTDVLDQCNKSSGMVMMLRSMAPKVIAIDEIGTKEDVEGIHLVSNSGVSIIATMHGFSIEEIRKKNLIKSCIEEGIFRRFIVLGRRDNSYFVKEIVDGEFNQCHKL